MKITIQDNYKEISKCTDDFTELIGKHVTNLFRISNLTVEEFLFISEKSPNEFFSKTDGPFLIEIDYNLIIGISRYESTGEIICWIEQNERKEKNVHETVLDTKDSSCITLDDWKFVEKNLQDIRGLAIIGIDFYSSAHKPNDSPIVSPVENVVFRLQNEKVLIVGSDITQSIDPFSVTADSTLLFKIQDEFYKID